jgi:peptide deformylase
MFEVILKEQTPNLPPMENPLEFLKENKEHLQAFLAFAQTKKAVGLAANQCTQMVFAGDDVRHERIMDRFMAIQTTAGWLIAINPVITETEGETFKTVEGCLTWPNMNVLVERYGKVKVQFTNMAGELHTRYADTQLEAQIWQHEINHLNGVEENIVAKDHMTIKRDGKKIGRNDPCSCGSGRKYKKCCG